MPWFPVMILVVFGMVSIAFMSQMPSEKPKHSIKRVIRGMDVKHPGVDPLEPEPEVMEETVHVKVKSVDRKPIRWHQMTSQYGDNIWKSAKCDNCVYEDDVKNADVVFAHPHKTKIKRQDPNQLWVSQFWESEGIYPDINTEKFDAFKSYRRDATFPCYAMMTDTFKPEKMIEPLPYEKKIDIEWMSVWLSNCGASGRNSLLKRLQSEGITTASYGRCKRDHSESELHFTSPEVDTWDAVKSGGNQKIAHSSNHLFLFAAENDISPFYHTEKLYHGLMAGSIPVYYGADTIGEYVPENSIIKASDYGSGLGDYLKKVANDKELYESYLAWRNKPLPDYLTSKLNYKCKNACEICEDLHDIKRGIREPVVEVEPEPVKEPNKINKSLVFTTKNRYGYVRLLAESLEWMKAYEHAHIHIFDDGSTDFTIQDLKYWFPYAHVHESDHRHPDMSIRHSFEWFENESNDDILITIDSDTMLHPDWNDFIDTHINRSGVLSLYHSAAKYHKSVNCNNVTCEKKSTGSMGMVMSRHVLEDMLHNMHNAEHEEAAFDWGFVGYFKKKGIKIIVPKNSLALHYGMYGAHGSGNHVEVANTFDFTPFPDYIKKKAKAFLKNKKPDKPNEFAIIIVADSNAQNKYKDNIENVKCYADHYQYTFIVTDTDSSCKGHFFFKKHCTVRNLMDTHDFKWALVIDGDVAVVNFKRQLTEFVSDDVSVVHGIRFHNNEIMAGIYFIRNDNYGKTYIQDWVNSGYKGFNYDNGALHYHLLDKLAQGVSGKEECKQKGQYSRDLHSYDQFVKCVHEVLSRSPCERRVRIMENSETNPEWIAIDSDRPKGTWTSTSFLHHAMKAPYQLRKAPKCSRSYFEGQTDDWFVSEDEYKKNLKDFWITEKRRDTGFKYSLCKEFDCSSFANKWTTSLVNKFVSLIVKTKDIFEKNNIEWSIAYGTALGYYRQQDFIQWDDDFDVIVPDDSINIILSISDNDLCSVRFWGGCKVFFCNENRIKGYSWSYPFIDVFKLTQEDDSSLQNDYETIFPTVDGKFHNITLPTPNKIITHLKNRFNDYTMCKSSTYNHKEEHSIKTASSVSCDKVIERCFN